MNHKILVEAHIRKQLPELMGLCPKCNGDGWFTGSKAGHACDSSEDSCQRSCPIEVPIQVGCDFCAGEGMIETQPITIAHYLRVLANGVKNNGWNEPAIHFSGVNGLRIGAGTPDMVVFNLTTQSPQSEEDYEKLAELFELV